MEGEIGFGRLAREIVATYRTRAALLLPAAFLLSVPLGLVDVLDERLFELDASELSWLAGIVLAIETLAHAGTALLGEVLFAGIAAAVVSERRTGVAHPLLDLLRTLPYGRLIVIDLLFNAGLAVGLLLLVVPGLVFFAWFALAAPLAKIEDLGVRDAFRRSRALVRGRFRTVLALLLPLAIATELLTEALQAGSVWAVGDSFLGDWAGAVAVGVLLTPIFAVASVVLAYDLLAAGPRDSTGRAARPWRVTARRESASRMVRTKEPRLSTLSTVS
jgi:hypothetical protein